MQTELTLVPVGGLANRMKAIDAAISLTQEVGAALRIVWFKDQGLNCRFNQLFSPLDLPNVTVKEASVADLFLLDRPRRKNFHLPSLFQRLQFSDCIYEEQATQLFYRQFDFPTWLKQHKRAYLASCVYFYSKPQEQRFRHFRPIPALQQQIDHLCAPFLHTIGVHIRRTDNAASIAQSPTELFISRMEEEIQRDASCTFYLATDSETDKALLKQRFGKRLFTSPQPTVRNTPNGIQAALIELYALSHTQRILGSAQSSYSETAAQLSDIICEIIKR